MNPELTKLIEQYLAGELSVSDKMAFENKMLNNLQLMEEVAFHRDLQDAAKRSVMRADITQLSKQYHWMQNLKWGGFGLAIIAIIATSYWFVSNYSSNKKEIPLTELAEITKELEDKAPIENLKSEFFTWNGSDTALLSTDGVLISIPENALLLNGKPYSDQAVIQWQEALDGTTIVKSGLSTVSNGNLLETQGMFSFSATTVDGKQLSINPKVGVYVQVPVNEYKEGMMLFDGQKDKDGTINWVKPKPLQKIPVPVSMKKLDFYPPEYEKTLNDLKARKDKKYRDSLYLSFESEETNNFKEINSQPAERSEPVQSVVNDIDATFPGGYGALIKFVRDNIIYPDDAMNQNISGKVIVDFIINKNGATSDIKIRRGVHPSIDREAIRVVQLLQNWIPAEMNGEKVSSYYSLPIDFSIEGNSKKSNSNNKSNLPKSAGSWEDKINWDFTVEYLPNNEAYIVAKAKLKKGWHIFSVDHDPNKADLTGYPTRINLQNNSNFSTIGKTIDGQTPLTVNNALGTSIFFENQGIFKQKIKILNNKPFQIKLDYSFQICDENGCIFPPNQITTLNVNGATETTELGFIPPSSVLGFWNPKFDNTLLATREFEKRMKAIHGTCSKKVLEVYTNNLNKSISELDELVVKMGYSNFNEFAAENIGALNPNNPHLDVLKAFYEDAINQLKAEEAQNREKELNKRNTWDSEVASERSKEQNRSANRNNKAYSEEKTLNYINALKQLGKEINYSSALKELDKKKQSSWRGQLGETVGATITRSGIYNIDAFVAKMTYERKSGSFYDINTGKTARIQYNDFKFNIANASEYKQIYAYLFPDKLNSYQRISGKNGSFDYPLNEALNYDLAIVAVSETGYAYFEKITVKGGNLGQLTLKQVSEKQLDANINLLNSKRGISPMRIDDEISWLFKEQKNYSEVKRREDERVFREKIRKVIFPCWEASGIAASTKEYPSVFGI